MSKRVLVGESQYLKPIDFERFGLFPQEALDDVVGDAVAYPAHWATFTVSKTSAQEVTVSPGRYFSGSTVYEADAAQTINLTTRFPLAASDEVYVALILRGEVEAEKEQRAFETMEDPETSVPVAIPTPVIRKRIVKVAVQSGVSAPSPALLPTIAETDACIAYVRLTTQGVQEITPGERWRVKSLFEVEGRVTGVELAQAAIRERTETLETGLTNANAAIEDLRAGQIRPEIFRQVRRDVAAMRRQLQVPDGARSDWYDPGLTLDQWDTTHALWLARISEGIQMPFADRKEARLEIRNEADPRIAFSGRRMVPAWTKVKRISNEGGRTARLISQLTHTEIEAFQRSVARTVTDYGPTVNVCENAAEWNRYAPQLQAGATFAKNGETFQAIANLGGGGGNAINTGHNIYAVREVKTSTYIDTYWEYQSKKVGLNGSVYGQTFTVDQPLVCPSVELEFAKIGSDGDVTVLFCELDPTGAPLVGEIIATAKVAYKDLKLGWVEFVGDLTYFGPGKRFAWYAVTTGNHQIYGSDDNAFAGGTSFQLTDGAWAQGDLKFDFNFRINGCRFTNARTVIDFKPMDLSGGMTQFRLLYPNWAPDGTAITWEVQPVFGGADAPWSQLQPKGSGNPLVGLPASVNLRATLISTPDLAPMIELSADAVYTTARVRNEQRSPSKAINLGLTTSTIQTLTVVDDFDPAVHTFTPRILAGSNTSLIAPDVTTVTVDPDRPKRRAFLSTYTVPAGTSVVRTVPGGSTSNIVDIFFVQNTALFAL